MALQARKLGTSSFDVSLLPLSSWQIFETIARETGLAIMIAARDDGVIFLDDARYYDEFGTAPIPTCYSEFVFGERFRAAGLEAFAEQNLSVNSVLCGATTPDQVRQNADALRHAAQAIYGLRAACLTV